MSRCLCHFVNMGEEKLIKNLVVDCTDMKWGVSASIPRVHVRPIEQQVLKVLHHPVSTDLGSID